MNRQAAEHRLDAEPATGHQRADQAWDVGTDNAKGRTQQHRKRNAVLGAGEGIERQRDQHNDVGKQNGQQRFTDTQSEIRRQHPAQGIGRHANRHADP
ncbi:hypothetical protein D3C76_1636970 [compost metagenome]